jgi:hypothetical protein
MPAVHNNQSRATDFCNGGRRGRDRRAKLQACSWFVLATAGVISTWAGTVRLDIGICLANALPTVNGPERSVSRDSVAAAKRKDTAQASSTRCWR